MDENTWRFAQLMMWIIGIQTTIFLSVLGVILSKLNKVDEKINRIDKEMIVITTTLRFNGFDLDRHKAGGE